MNNSETTTLISLFHSDTRANEALTDLREAGIPTSQIHQLGGSGDASLTSLQDAALPPQDLQMLADGVRDGGTVIVLTQADEKLAGKAEAIFRKHHAREVDEQVISDGVPVAQSSAAATAGAIPVIEEEMVVGKRAFQSGGVRIISRVVETPVSENITLHEEHAVVERRPVSREATEADLAFGEKSFEVINRDEEAVISKTARVVEEVVVGKTSTQHSERVSDTVRKTEVEVERLAADDLSKSKGTKKI